MSEKTIKAQLKIQDREMFRKAVTERDNAIILLRQRSLQLNKIAEGLKELAKKVVSERQAAGALQFAINQDQYIRHQIRVQAFEESFGLIAGSHPGSEQFEKVLKLGAKV